MKQAVEHGLPRTAEISGRIRRILLDEPGIQLVLLHGSAACGKMRSDSDIDLAVLFDRPLTAEARLSLAARLERELHRPIDLVDLAELNGTILKQILCKGKVLVVKQPASLAALVERMIYNQADMMPYVRRTLAERQRRFVHG